MAKKLRWHTIRLTDADATTGVDNGARFVNESQQDYHVRQQHWQMELTAAAPGEGGDAQLSFQSTFARVNDEDEYRETVSVGMPATGATPVDGDANRNQEYYFDRGQLIIEPGESLKLSTNKTNGGALRTGILIGFELEE